MVVWKIGAWSEIIYANPTRNYLDLKLDPLITNFEAPKAQTSIYIRQHKTVIIFNPRAMLKIRYCCQYGP